MPSSNKKDSDQLVQIFFVFLFLFYIYRPIFISVLCDKIEMNEQRTQKPFSHKITTMSSLEMFKEERVFWGEGYEFVVGIDEAGRGPLAGPVVAAAVALRNNQDTRNNNQTNFNDPISNNQSFVKSLALIRDSKTLSEKQREKMYDFILENFHVGIGICDHKTIDRINILEATYLAMKKAISDLLRAVNNQETRDKIQTNSKYQIPNDKQISKSECQNFRHILLVDGNKIIPNLSLEQKAIVNGDKTVKSISAASIVAKVTRDRMMREYHEKYPQYQFDRHKGYGTAAHMVALREYGPCEIHRVSFRPVKVVSGI